MEHRTEFNLGNSIKDWKSNLSNSHSMTKDNIQELESHLLDEMDNLRIKGLNEEEAFMIGTKRIGSTGFLVSEFNKLNAFNTFVLRSMPFLKGILFYLSLSFIISILGRLSLLFSYYFNINLGVSNTIFVLTFFLILFIVCYNTYDKIRKGKRVGKIFNNVPLLVLGVVLLRILEIALFPLITRQNTMSQLAHSMEKVHYFGYWVTILLLIVSIVFYFKSKQIQKRKIA